jgi:hypothetical protein
MIAHLIGLIFVFIMNKTMTKATDIVIEKAIDITSTEVISIATKIKDETIKYISHEEIKPIEKNEN